ncbi:Hypothetical protein BRZCDTV_462 [Brazilian cedratvirus IHUMI]|uniref:Uncharacterized protein n=1 Tax=Brazilian cedratvirus IHUMI TaxID=2126980 RepID=A0A2R8FFE2_9VIRU|nr:Hypothetical protein BRZCDTV_462 [Brazilian cedratvirus IHUMI]
MEVQLYLLQQGTQAENIIFTASHTFVHTSPGTGFVNYNVVVNFTDTTNVGTVVAETRAINAVRFQ